MLSFVSSAYNAKMEWEFLAMKSLPLPPVTAFIQRLTVQ